MSETTSEDLLRKVLILERKQDFDNRAMVGGLAAFARRLHGEAAAASPIPQAALLLAGYDGSDRPARSRAIEAAIAVLNGHAPSAAGGPVEATVEPAPRARRSTGSTLPAVETPDRASELAPPTAEGVLGFVVTNVSGVGPSTANQLAPVGLETVGDILYYFPREHLDYRRRDRIRWLRPGERTTIIATIESVRLRRIRKGLSITDVLLADDSGRIQAQWFNQPYLEKSFRTGRRLAVSGEAEILDGRRVFKPRDYEWIDDGELTHAARLVPIYPLKKGLHQKSLRSLIRRTVDEFASRVSDPLPSYLTNEYDLPALSDAIRRYHFPNDEADAGDARRRLAFDEILCIQLGLRLRKREWKEAGGAPAITITESERQEFWAALSFSPTAAQVRVMRDLERSLGSERPMSRLVQGDVGSGKTVIAALALYGAALRGFQSVMMAPTEILAQQHLASVTRWLSPLGVRVSLLTGSTPAKERRRVLEAAAAGEVDVLIGTHVLFQEAVLMKALGVAVVDEQHRFGVEQRSRLRQKGVSPHLLAMTATPIPRTLQLTLYGDLDISVIDELPPGRVPIETSLCSDPGRAYRLVGQQVTAGRQAFVVCPVIEESLDEDMKSAVAEHKRLENDIFRHREIGLLHGRMKSKEKDAVLMAFRDGELNVLVATSVVEVGIDVPNATVMVIRDAHRFGLAQLHQLRGRIGRGAERSYCVLVSPASDGPTGERLRAVVDSQDGFALAEKDLELRGPGEFWGTRQSGMPELRVAGPGDGPIMEAARSAADMILERDGGLQLPEHAGLKSEVNRLRARQAELH